MVWVMKLIRKGFNDMDIVKKIDFHFLNCDAFINDDLDTYFIDKANAIMIVK